MNRLLLICFVILVLLGAIAEARRGGRKRGKSGKQGGAEGVDQSSQTRKERRRDKQARERGGRRRQNDDAKDCGPWIWDACMPSEGECGMGVKVGTREGPDCKVLSKTKRCQVACGSDRQKKECKYTVGELAECDSSIGSRNVVLRLKKGNPDTCPVEKTITKRCKRDKNKRGCKFEKGDWGLCDTPTDTRVRLDTLVEDKTEEQECSTERVIVKKCSFGCKYEWSDWGECDENSRTRSREGVIMRKSSPPADCPSTTTQSRLCYNKKGVEKCFFGPWEKSKECVDGMRTKRRQVLAGGKRCEKKATSNRKCKA
ncbi:uncharacterized protein LOC100374442 [Saccoglossus kowalevskii]|uniref:Pleiotrophin-like 150 n=1 Tax=Saccoglossus kowalevskii TaxID=10224 RepID=A0A0U2USR3_SACKO|nr:PREDICTED: uncharacterized protein LOC100374442 isoform X2 [Saccoglossus kowalevskii]XP_006824179.1 PREDICTED: uncharacterized protein LOC100374442 isoform X3 [Saccoglossus kowalevskii]ALR88654.1 pleiotrophin-like 150 [Saccoglossus kowalevskii]